MLEVLDEKIRNLKLANMSTRLLDLTGETAFEDRFHLVHTSMILHHIGPVDVLIEGFYSALHPGGRLAMADLDREDGDFHGYAQGVAHHGFDRLEPEDILKAKGFTAVKTVTAHELSKEVSGGGKKTFPVFLMTGRRP